MDRRSLLKSATAFVAVAAIPSTPAIAALPEPAMAAAVVTPAKLSPYTDYVWEWFVSNDGEVYHESFPTKEEALAYAKECKYSIVAECLPQDFDLTVDGDWLIEQLDELNYERIGEGDGIDATRPQIADLEKMVSQAIGAWVVKHKIDIRSWSFVEVANETRVPSPAFSEYDGDTP